MMLDDSLTCNLEQASTALTRIEASLSNNRLVNSSFKCSYKSSLQRRFCQNLRVTLQYSNSTHLIGPIESIVRAMSWQTRNLTFLSLAPVPFKRCLSKNSVNRDDNVS